YFALHDFVGFAGIEVRTCDQGRRRLVAEVHLLHLRKAPELLLPGIVIAVVVAELADVLMAEGIKVGDGGNHLDRKRHWIWPRASSGPIFERELRGRSIADERDATDAIRDRG